jgi:cytochrome d ubiquinol oxidase subunit I
VAPLFWSFRLMVGVGFYFILFFATAFWFASTQQLDKRRWFLKLAFYSLPLPWLAIEAGWLIAEYGRQPWIIDGVLPTFFAASGLKLHQILISLAGFIIVYTTLAVIDVWLMRKVIKKGPEAMSESQSEDDAAPAAANA